MRNHDEGLKSITQNVYYKYEINEITNNHKAIVCTLAGLSARISGRDDFYDLVLEMEKKDNTIIPIWGKGHTRTSPQDIAIYIKKIVKKTREKWNKSPLVIFVGKSYGGYKLHEVHKQLNLMKIKIDINLFVGVEVSSWPSRHHQKFIDSKGKHGAKWFVNDVKKLYGFYQTTGGVIQTGSPLFYKRSKKDDFKSIILLEEPQIPSEHDSAYNIHVQKTPFNKTTLIPDEDNGSYILPENTPEYKITHLNIDTQPKLLNIVTKLINRELK